MRIAAQSAKNDSVSKPDTPANSDRQLAFTVFPVGINLNGRAVDTSALIKGAEDGSRAINFEQWLIPFDVVVEALGIKVTTLDNGIWELRSPEVITTIDPEQLITDKDLGLVFKVAQIREILAVPTEFELREYAIAFTTFRPNSTDNIAEIPIDTTGLPKAEPSRFTFTTVGQRFRISNSDIGDRDFNSRSDFSAIGTVFGGSWYTRINQTELGDLGSWQLGEFQYLRQTNNIDYALGSQSTFWQNNEDGQYWGVTALRRFGFAPDTNRSSGGFNPDLRRQPQVIERAIAGKAQPGDVVHLVTKRRQEIIEEIIVDATGVYQFDNIDYRNDNYQILIYPQGRLTLAPEIIDPILTYTSGQLSRDTSTLTLSTGIKRDLSEDSFWGDFNDLGGGVNYRHGITDELTLGTGLVVDRSLFALGELFYQPNNVPLQLGVSALVNPELKDADYTAYFYYQPSEKLNFSFNGNSSNHALRFNWRASRDLSFRLGNDERDDAIAGLTFNKSGKLSPQGKISLLTNLDYGNNEGLRQRIDARYNAFQFAHQGDREATFSRLSYSLSNDFYNPTGHAIFAGYDTRNSDNSNSVINLGWHYRSGQNANDGGSLWDVELGYGFNSTGSAPLAALTTRAVPGTTIRLSYQGISPTDNDSSLRLDVFPNLRLQGRPRLGDRNPTRLRTSGGLLVRPFTDKNSNGKLDSGEEIHTEDAELLLTINHESLHSSRKEITERGVFVALEPGTYRLDLDPAGYPFNSQPSEPSYAAKVTAGSYTELDIPFEPSYTVIGAVTDSQGEPVAGAKVEAISAKSDRPILSVTNSAGVYFLEGLSQNTYNLNVNDRSVNIEPLTITPNSQSLQEINIKLVN